MTKHGGHDLNRGSGGIFITWKELLNCRPKPMVHVHTTIALAVVGPPMGVCVRPAIAILTHY